MRTQFNIRLPQATVERLERIRARLGLTQSDLIDRLVNTEWGRMEQRSDVFMYPNPKTVDTLKNMNGPQLDDLEIAIRASRLEMAAAELRRRGMTVITSLPAIDATLNYLLVLAPGFYKNFSAAERETLPRNVLANLGEARHLLDFLQNLSPAEAYRRWCKEFPSQRNDMLADYMEPADIHHEIYLLNQKMDSNPYADNDDLWQQAFNMSNALRILEGKDS
jgi:hypothetical protein